MPTVIFLAVSNNGIKARAICETIHQQFLKGETVLIAVSNEEAAAYIDQLLWRMPEESFVPHSVTDRASAERVVITKGKANVNRASVCFNLSSEHYPDTDMKWIFELMDLTHLDKKKLSEQRLHAYRSQGHNIMEHSYVHSL